jgi:hypothetical protein
MPHAVSIKRVVGQIGTFFEHAAVVVVGLILMVVGLGMGVTMIMLPVGVVVGLIGVLMVIGGLFSRIKDR